MQRQEQTHGIDHVPDRDRPRERQRPNWLRIIWKRIGERRHKEREGRRVVERPSVLIGDFVEWVSGPQGPASAEENLHVALSEPNSLPKDDRKKQHREGSKDCDCHPFSPPWSRYRFKREETAVHAVGRTLLAVEMQPAFVHSRAFDTLHQPCSTLIVSRSSVEATIDAERRRVLTRGVNRDEWYTSL